MSATNEAGERTEWKPNPEPYPQMEGRSNLFDRHDERNKAGFGIEPGVQPVDEADSFVVPSAEDQDEPIDHSREEEEVKTAVPTYSSNSMQRPTIYNVPHELAEDNRRAYTPLAVCIGPILGSKENNSHSYRAAHKYKRCCVRRLIVSSRQAPQDQATWTDAEGRLLRMCLDRLKSLRPQIQASYDDLTGDVQKYTVQFGTYRYKAGRGKFYENTGKLEKQMLHDGCFVLHRLLKHARMARRRDEQGNATGNGDGDDDDDDWTLVFGRCWVWGFITYDLLLLENQIPFFVLQVLLELLKPDEREDVLVTGALELFRPLHPHGQHTRPIACRDVHHLLHLFYLSISFPTPTPGDELRASTRRHLLPSELPLWVPCAKELEEAGVKFRARKHGAESFLDVRFRGGVLEIPPLRLYDYSESLFRNLIAFEQTYPGTRGHVTAYAIFMACLVTTHEDMRLLHQSGILANQMSSGEKDATHFFSRVSAHAHTSADLNYLAGVMEEVVTYQSGRWPRWRASLVRNYFSNPWVIMSVAAAVFLLVLTVVQAFFAAYAYFKPPAS